MANASSAAEPAPRQLDIFADSDDVRRRNDFIDAVLACDTAGAAARLLSWQQDYADDALLPAAALVLERLREDAREAASVAAPIAALLAARTQLEREVSEAARSVLGSDASAWLAGRWRALAKRASHVTWHPNAAEAHAAAMALRAGDWAAAAQAVAAIESWRRIPLPLLWMAEARWCLEGADAAWPLLAEAFWLAPAHARVLLERVADQRLTKQMRRFEDDFEITGHGEEGLADWAWWPAWLAVEQPLLAKVLAAAEGSRERAAAQGFALVVSLLRLESEGRHHDIVASRKHLRSLEPRLFACYMRTR
jgi:hypothetical protein